jgi:hypothetical protein
MCVMDVLFTLAGFAIVGWVLLILFPRWPLTRTAAGSAVVPAYLAVLYVAALVLLVVRAGPGFVGDFATADGVARLLAHRDAALVVWIHVLAFDQLVGILIYRDNMQHRIVRLPVQSVILVLTLMFGPAGFLVYYMIRLSRRPGAALGDAATARVRTGL